jgi:tripartite-type tricarboxylate transporter receptor subunit TctC
MEKSLGQTIVVENVGGAGGMIAAARAARAEPDGYTILIHQVALAAGVTLYPKLSFDGVKDFAPIGLVNNTASTLSAPASLPPENFKEFLHWAKEPGHNIKIGHPGVGSFGHLAGGMVLFPPEEETPEAAHAVLKHEIKLWHDVITANKIAAQ